MPGEPKPWTAGRFRLADSVCRVLCWSFLGLGLAGLSSATEAGDRDATLRAYIEIWNTGDTGRLADLAAPGFERHAGPDESCRSLDDLEQIILRTRAIYDRLKITIDDHVTDGDKGAFRGQFSGVHRDVDRVVEFPIMGMIRFAEGLIAEEWIIGDNFLPLMGLGYQLVPPGFEAVPPDASSPAANAPSGNGSR